MRIAVIGGSGIEDRLSREGGLEIIGNERPHTPFGEPSAPLTIARRGDTDVVLLQRHGESHRLPPHKVPYRANIFALKALGVTHAVLTGAVGSLREEIIPGIPVLCDQLIDRTTARGDERTFFDGAAVHVEMAEPYCPVVRAWLKAAAESSGAELRDGGTCVTIDGPAFSTRAESHMHRALGADMVGMTASTEARLLREAEIASALIALPTDYDCWRPHTQTSGESLIEEIMENLAHVTEAAIRLIGAALDDPSPLARTPSPAHDALALAVWTPAGAIDHAEQARLAPLWAHRLRDTRK